ASKQGLEHQLADAGGCGALDRERVVLVEVRDTGSGRPHEVAALRRVRVYPLEVLEARRVLDVAELRVGVRSQPAPGKQDAQQENPNPHCALPGMEESRSWV